jgi:hypothetical protein
LALTDVYLAQVSFVVVSKEDIIELPKIYSWVSCPDSIMDWNQGVCNRLVGHVDQVKEARNTHTILGHQDGGGRILLNWI